MRLRPWEPLPNLKAYYKRLGAQILADSFLYWWQQMVGGLFLGVIGALVSRQYGWILHSDAARTIGIALIPFVAMMLLTLIVNAIRAPAKLDRDRVQKTEELEKGLSAERQRTAALSSEMVSVRNPRRTQAQEHQYNEARQALEKLGLKGLIVLQHLHTHGSLKFGVYPPPLPPGMQQSEVADILHHAQDLGLATGTHSHIPGGNELTYRIASGKQKALEELLYESSSPSDQT